MQAQWEAELSDLLNDLVGVQDELLALVDDKQQALVAGDFQRLDAVQADEQILLTRLETCRDRRADILQRAEGSGLPADDLRSLATAVVDDHSQSSLPVQFHQAASRIQVLRSKSLTNWVLAQRSLIHLSQLLETLATGGRQRPTYGPTGGQRPTGSLMDTEM